MDENREKREEKDKEGDLTGKEFSMLCFVCRPFLVFVNDIWKHEQNDGLVAVVVETAVFCLKKRERREQEKGRRKERIAEREGSQL